MYKIRDGQKKVSRPDSGGIRFGSFNEKLSVCWFGTHCCDDKSKLYNSFVVFQSKLNPCHLRILSAGAGVSDELN